MTIDEMIEVLQAYKDGKKIECRCNRIEDSEWHEAVNPCWDFDLFEYRVKPESTYRPYKDVAEMVADYDARFQSKARPDHTMPLIWLKSRLGHCYIVCGYTEGVGIYVLDRFTPVSDLFATYTYLDGTPCGKLEEQ